MTDMKLSKVLKKDIIKHLGITPDRRRKDFKQFIAENGGYNNAIETLKSRLNEKTEFKAKKEVRSKQITIQKEYIERKQNPTARPKRPRTNKKTIEKRNINATTIQKIYRTQKRIDKERNRLFTLEPSKIWNTKFSYDLRNHLPSSEIRHDTETGEVLYLARHDMVEVFQYYKIGAYLIQKLEELKKGYKINLGYSITLKNLVEGKTIDYKNIIKSLTIYDKSDIYKYFEKVYDEFHYLAEEYNKAVVKINNIYIDIYKVKPLNGKSYIALPENIANKKAVINIKNEDNNCFIYSVLCGYLDICDKPHPERVNHYTKHMKLLKYDEKICR